MYEQGRIVEINGPSRVSVSCGSQSCNSCKSSLFCKTKGRVFQAHVKETLHLQVGDTVELFLPPAKTIFASVLTLVTPLLLFPLGYYLPAILKLGTQESLKIILGFVGMAVGFLFVHLFNRVHGESFVPTVTRVLLTEPEGTAKG